MLGAILFTICLFSFNNLKNKLKEPGSVVVDGWVTAYFIMSIKDLMGKDIKLADELIEAYNGQLKPEHPKISREIIAKSNIDVIEKMTMDSDKRLDEKGTQYVLDAVMQKDTPVVSDDLEQKKDTPVISNDLEQKEDTQTFSNINKVHMNKIRKVITIWLSNEKVPERAKDTVQNNILEDMKKWKDQPEMNFKEAQEQRRELFDKILGREIAKGKINEEAIKSMIEIDPNAVKGILKEVLIPTQNDAPSNVLGGYIQYMSEQMSEASKQEVLNSDKTDFSRVIGKNSLVGSKEEKEDDCR